MKMETTLWRGRRMCAVAALLALAVAHTSVARAGGNTPTA